MNSFTLAKGMTVPNLDGIHECYKVEERNGAFVFTANVSNQNIEKLIRSFCESLEEPCFFILEIPTNEGDESELRKENTSPFHCDVFYWDGLSVCGLLEIVRKHGDLLINDGLTCFGFASHASHDELYFGKYNIATIFSSDEERHRGLFARLNIPQEEEIKTVWDSFSQTAPGRAERISINGKDIYNVLDSLKTEGLYFAERREQ